MATVAFDCAVKGNEARSGEYLAGQFLAGYDPVRFTANLTNIQFVPVTGGIAGKATVAPALAVTHTVAATVARSSAVSASLGRTVSFGCTITRSATVVAQVAPVRTMAATVAGAGAVAPTLARTRSLVVPISRAASVVVAMEPVNASFVRFDTVIARAAAVIAQASETRGLTASVSGLAVVAPDLTVVTPNYVTFGVSVQGQAQVSADVRIGSTRLLAATVQGQAAVDVPLGRLILFSSTVAGAGAINVTATKIIPFEARIQTLVPICGENLCNVLAIGGPFICGGFSGPHAVIDVGGLVGLAIDKVFPAEIVGKAEVGASLGITRSLVVDVEGVGVVDMPWLALKLSLTVPIGGYASVKAKLLLFWTFPTVPVDILLPPTVEVPWILYPTLPGTGELVGTVEENVLLEPTEDEDWVLVPTVERG